MTYLALTAYTTHELIENKNAANIVYLNKIKNTVKYILNLLEVY